MSKLPIYRSGFLFLVWLFVYFEPLINMATVWTQSKTYEHGMAIVPISLWLAWRKKEQVKQAGFTTCYLPLILMIFPLSLWMMGKAADIALFEHAALVFSFQLLIWFSIGTEKAKAVFFPIFYLVFCIPFGEELIPHLQIITADITVFLIQLSGIPIYREGLFLTIPNGMFEVAEACSGIRFLISSIALGFLFSYLSFTKWWKHTAFVIFSFIFPIIANGIRAYGIVLIGYLSDMKYATGADHLIYGWVFFSFVIISIFFIANQFADIPKEATFSPVPNLEHKSSNVMLGNIISIALMIVFSFQLVWEKSLNAQAKKGTPPITLPAHFIKTDKSLWGVNFPNAQQSVLAKKAEGNTEIYIATSQTYYSGSEFITYENKLYDQRVWSVVSSSKRALENKTNVRAVQIVNNAGIHRHLIYWYCINDYCTDSRSMVKFLKAFHVIINNSVELRFTAVLTNSFNDEEIKSLANMLNVSAKENKVKS